MVTVIAYTYEADVHCMECTIRRFGILELLACEAKDSEGNPVHPVFSTDEIAEPQEGCGTCGEPLE